MDKNPLNTELIYAVVFLNDLSIERFNTWGDYMNAIMRANQAQRPYTVFHLKNRNGHSTRCWHPVETRYFDPKKVLH